MTPVSRFGVALVLLGITGNSHPAFAGNADYSTTVVNPFFTQVDQYTVTTDAASPTFNRPGLANVPGVTPNPTSLSGTGTAVAYATHDFTAASNGTSQTAGAGVYKIATTIVSGYATPATSPNGTSNFVQVIYSQPFDPANPLTNAQLAYSQGDTTGSYLTTLADGAYTAVNAGYYNANKTGGRRSVGTTTTTISQENFGSTSFVPDFDPTRSSQLGASQTLTLGGPGIVTAFNSFTFVGLQSNSVGFLAATLTHDGKMVNLFNNPASGTLGALASFDGSQTYKFADSGHDLAAAANDAVNAGGPFDTVFPIAGDTFQSLDPLSAFVGTRLAGDWTLNVVDSTYSDNAQFLGFSFNANTSPVPEASSLVGMSLACLILAALVFKRRRTALSE